MMPSAEQFLQFHVFLVHCPHFTEKRLDLGERARIHCNTARLSGIVVNVDGAKHFMAQQLDQRL